MQNAQISVQYGYATEPFQLAQCANAPCQVFGEYPSGTYYTAASRIPTYTYAFQSVVQIGVQDAQPLGLGGWTLSANHVYDPTARILWGGDGKRRTMEAATSVINTVAGSACGGPSGDGGPALSALFNDIFALAPLPDGRTTWRTRERFAT